jgi:hypothetical protein
MKIFVRNGILFINNQAIPTGEFFYNLNPAKTRIDLWFEENKIIVNTLITSIFSDEAGTIPYASSDGLELILSPYLSPTGGGGGGGDASAANQLLQITQETKIAKAVATAPNSASISVAASIIVVTLAAANANRRTLEISNAGTQILYIKKGAAASLTDYTYKLTTDDTAIINDYSGIVTGIWDVANGSAIGTEITF